MPTEQKYWVYERELVAMAYCLQSWWHYLEGCLGGTTILTDHQMLICIMDQPVLNPAQTRWIRLGLFDLIDPIIKYNLGRANIVTDALSRGQRKMEEKSQDVDAEEVIALSGTELEVMEDTRDHWIAACAALQELQSGRPFG